jgi:hypothetical protein
MGIQMGGINEVRDYDVMVYQTSSQTIAVNSNGRRISVQSISAQQDDVVINAALTYMDSLIAGYTTGKTLRIASGTYYIYRTISIVKPHTIRGAGTVATILKAKSNSSLQTIFDINADAHQWGGGSASWSAYAGGNFVLSDMTLDGNHDCHTGILFGDGYTYDDCNPETAYTKFDNVKFADFTRWGVFDNSTFGSTYTNCSFTGNGSPVNPGSLATYTAGAGTNTTHIHAPLTSLVDQQYYYDTWYLYNNTRGIGVPIYNYENVGKIIEFPAATTIAGQVAGDTFTIFPPYAGAAVFGTGHYQCTFIGCTFNQNAMGIYSYHARETEIRDCFFYDNYYHGIYLYGGYGYDTKYNRISGCFFVASGAYNSPGTSNGLYDIFISFSGNQYTSISEIFTFDDYVKSSLFTRGNYTTIQNYQTESGTIGTLGGTGSINVNTLAITSSAYKGAIDCHLNPDYPAASVGDMYVCSVAGKIGGAGGVSVVSGDYAFCHTAGIAGDQAAVGANWDVVHPMGAVEGTATVVAGDLFVAVPHGFGGAPANIIVTPAGAVSGRDYWADTVGAVTFNLNISSADVVDHDFYWRVG